MRAPGPPLPTLLLVAMVLLAPWGVLASSGAGPDAGGCDEEQVRSSNETSNAHGHSRSRSETHERSCHQETTYLEVEDEKAPANASARESHWERERATERTSESSWTIGDLTSEGNSTQRSSQGEAGWEQRAHVGTPAAQAVLSRGCTHAWSEESHRSSGSSTSATGNGSGSSSGWRSDAADQCHTSLSVQGPAGPVTAEHETTSWHRSAHQEQTSQSDRGPYEQQEGWVDERERGNRETFEIDAAGQHTALEHSCWTTGEREEHEATGDGAFTPSSERVRQGAEEDGCWTGASAAGPAGPASAGLDERCGSSEAVREAEGGFGGDRRSSRAASGCKRGLEGNVSGQHVWIGHVDGCSRHTMEWDGYEERSQGCRDGVVVAQGSNETFVGRARGCEARERPASEGWASSAERTSRCWSDARAEVGDARARAGTSCEREEATVSSNTSGHEASSEHCRTGLFLGPEGEPLLFAGMEAACREREDNASEVRFHECSDGLTAEGPEGRLIHVGERCWNGSVAGSGSHGCRRGAWADAAGVHGFVGQEDSCHDLAVHPTREPGNKTRCHQGLMVDTPAATAGTGTWCTEEDGRTPSGRSASSMCTEGAGATTPAGVVRVGERSGCSTSHGTRYNLSHRGRSCERGLTVDAPAAQVGYGWRCSAGEVTFGNRTSHGRGCAEGLWAHGPSGTSAEAGSRETCSEPEGEPEPCQDRERRESGVSVGASTPTGSESVEHWEETSGLP